jgi:hypothetical protein
LFRGGDRVKPKIVHRHNVTESEFFQANQTAIHSWQAPFCNSGIPQSEGLKRGRLPKVIDASEEAKIKVPGVVTRISIWLGFTLLD